MINNSRAYLYIVISSKYWHNGYAKESLNRVINFLIKDVGIKYIDAGCDSLNINSKKMLENNGFNMVNILPNMGYNPDTKLYSEDRYEYRYKR